MLKKLYYNNSTKILIKISLAKIGIMPYKLNKIILQRELAGDLKPLVVMIPEQLTTSLF